MKRLVITIILLPAIIFINDLLFAQERWKPMSVTETVVDTIDIHYTGKWGWHKIHKISLKGFLKEAPFRRTDICLECHDENKYKIFDPHKQLNENGDIIGEKCLYCHIEKPDEIRATYQDVKLIGNPEMLCQGCHSGRSHPADANHLLKPSVETLAIMKDVENQFGIILPLNYDGKIICATCHNPHETGLIPAERAEAKGAREEFRHRLPDKICLACHQK